MAAKGTGERGVAEFVVCDVAEDEPVMPFTPGLLERFEGCGEFAGSACHFGSRLGDVASQFGVFADGVELIGIVRVDSAGKSVGEPALGRGPPAGLR